MDTRGQPGKNSDEGKSISASNFLFSFGICSKVVNIDISSVIGKTKKKKKYPVISPLHRL